MKANLQHYAFRTIDEYPANELFVIRTNSVWEDMASLDRLLGGDGDFGQKSGTKFTHASEHSRISTALSESAVFRMCCALQSEMAVFQRILFASVNLDAAAKNETWKDAMYRCGREHWDQYLNYCSSNVAGS